MAKIITDFKEMPWKNGGGTTKEIFRIPHPDRPEQFLFRISMATVQRSGPFSKFPGIHRYLMLLSGNGFVLNKKIRFNLPTDHFEFPGDEDVSCELINGACTDFNVMTDVSWGQSKVKVWKLKKGDSQSFQTSYLFLYKPQVELLILEPQEVCSIDAKEDMIVAEIQVNREVG